MRIVLLSTKKDSLNLVSTSFELTNTSNTQDSIYTINLAVGDTAGCIHDTSITVVIHPLPFADFTIDDHFSSLSRSYSKYR